MCLKNNENLPAGIQVIIDELLELYGEKTTPAVLCDTPPEDFKKGTSKCISHLQSQLYWDSKHYGFPWSNRNNEIC